MDPAGSLTNYTQKVRPNYKDIPRGTHLNRSRTRLPYIGKEVIAGLESTRKGVNGGDVGYWQKTDGGKGDISIGKEPDALPSLRALEVVVLDSVIAGRGKIVCGCSVILHDMEHKW